MFKKLRIQLTIVCAISVGIVLIVMSVVALLFTTYTMKEQSEKNFTTDINSVFYYLGSQNFIDQTWINKTESNNGLIIRINIKDKDLVYTSHDPLRYNITQTARVYASENLGFDYAKQPTSVSQPDMVTFKINVDKNEYRAAVATVNYGSDWLGVTILKDTSEENLAVFKIRLITILSLIVALTFIIIFAHYFIGYTLKPIEQNQKNQIDFVSAASHELRSPLAVISASAGAIKRGSLNDAIKYADKIESECRRLSRLTSDLLTLANVNNRSLHINLNEVNPETIVLNMLERFEDIALQEGINLVVDIKNDILPIIYADEHRIEQALTILIDNALGYSPYGGTVCLGTYMRGKNVYFAISDNGPGVPDKDKKRIFNRFYRGDSSRTDKDHFGIGLSIAMEIALLHNGILQIHDNDDGGAKFILKIPYKKV